MNSHQITNPAAINITKDDRTLCNGAVVLFKRPRSKRWQARIRRQSGEWIDKSTGEKDYCAASAKAEEMYRELMYAQKTGKIDVTRRFSSICNLCKKELLAEAVRTNKQNPKNYAQVIDKYIQPILGNYLCHNIDTNALVMFSQKRAAMMGHVPTQSTVATHNSALSYLFKKAKAKGFIEFIPKTINDGRDSKRRPYFNDADMRILNANMRHYVKHNQNLANQKGRNGIETISLKTLWIRELLRDVVLILVNTGMRPGEEVLNLKWKNLRIVTQHDKQSIQFSLPHSKTIKRVVIGYEPVIRADGKKYGCWSALERIRDRFDNLKDLDWEELTTVDEYIFRYRDGSRAIQENLTKAFKHMLKWITVPGQPDGLLRDSFGEERTLYSLRHTYVSRMRYKGISFDDISVQVGTKVDTLERHYSHFTVSDNPNKYAGHERRAEKEKQKAAEDNNMIIKQLLEQNAKKDEQIQQLLEQLLNKENGN